MAGKRGLLAVCAAATAALLVVGTPPRRSPPPRPHTPATLRGALPGLKSFVERARLLPFERGVDVFVLDDPGFEAAVARLGASAADPARHSEQSRLAVGFLKALGLVPADVQAAAVAAADSSSLLGLYDPVAKRILVRGTLSTSLLHRVVVHELTHALDDQHFSFAGIKVDPRTEEGLALKALVEGDAARVDKLYRDHLSPRQRAAANAPPEGLAPAPASAERLMALLSFPYVAGPRFVQAILEQQGAGALNAAFRAPPRTSQEILHPERFRKRVPVPEVRRPSADGPVLAVGVLGEMGLRLVLGETLPNGAAVDVATGWGGDEYVAWVAGERTCVRVNIMMAGAPATNQVRDGLQQWAAAHPGADVRLSGQLTTITRCA